MNAARGRHTATFLPDGHVLVTGGYDGTDFLSSGELYDPTAGVFVFTGNMITPHFNHAATLLPDGRVLIVDGWVCAQLCNIYNNLGNAQVASVPAPLTHHPVIPQAQLPSVGMRLAAIHRTEEGPVRGMVAWILGCGEPYRGCLWIIANRYVPVAEFAQVVGWLEGWVYILATEGERDTGGDPAKWDDRSFGLEETSGTVNGWTVRS